MDAVFDDSNTIIQRGGHTLQSLTEMAPTVHGHVDPGPAKRTFTNRDTLFIESSTGVHSVIPDVGTSMVMPQAPSTSVDVLDMNAKFLRAGAVTKGVSGALERLPSTVTSLYRVGGHVVWVYASHIAALDLRLLLRWGEH